jgi:tetratricopeptide (TPR) repeat protein
MLNSRRLFDFLTMTAVCVSCAQFQSETIAEEFTLARVIPNDVFIFENCRQNPERKFLEEYWDEVIDTLKQSGIDEDLAELFGTALGLDDEQTEEIDRLKTRFLDLIGEVDWKQLVGTENAFAERFQPIAIIAEGRPAIVAASLVWLSRGSAESTVHNYEALVAILEAIVEEVNRSLGRELLEVEHGEQMGAQMVSVNLLGAVPGAPSLPLSVAMRDNLLMIAFREDLRDDVLRLMDGKDASTSLTDDPRFVDAFTQLPPAEDKMTFFDMRALLEPVQESIDVVFSVMLNPNDVYRNTGINAEASKINVKALTAYHRGDNKTALALVKEAYEIEPKDSIILYNLACFSALVGEKDEALDWLEQAVESGFYGPKKISTDADLRGLRDDPRYKQVLKKAETLARECGAEDVAVHYTDKGDVRRLRMQVQQAYEKKDIDQALELIEQAYTLAPKDSKVLYAMGCLHTLKGHKDKGLEFLQQAVDAGFYCPRAIAKDPDWESVRTNKRYERAIADAEKLAGKASIDRRVGKTTLIKRLIDRQIEAAGALDYAATVESTDGHSVWQESITMLVPDAPDRPIYRVFSQRQPLTDFARYLPQETMAFSISGGVHVAELYGFVEETLRGGGPLGEEMLATWEDIQQRIGLDVKQDVIGLIDGDSISVTLEGGASVWMTKVTDEQKVYEMVDQALTELPKLITTAVAKQPALGGLAALAFRCSPLAHEELDGFQGIHIAMSPKPIGVWGVVDDYLVFGSSADAVALCLATSQGEHPNIQSNESAISEAIIPDGPFVSLSLSDRRTTSKDAAMAMGAASMMGGMVAASIPKPELRPVVMKMTSIIGKLAPVAKKVDFYKSVASSTTFDGQMWRCRSVTHYQSPTERSAAEDENQDDD